MLTPELQEKYVPEAIDSSLASLAGKSASEIVAEFTTKDVKKELGISGGDAETPSKKRIAERFERELFSGLIRVISDETVRQTPIGDENLMTEEGVADLQNIDAYYQLLQAMPPQLRTDKQFLIEQIKVDSTLLIALRADKGFEVKNPQPLGSETQAFVAACCKDRDLALLAIKSDPRTLAIFHEDLRKDSTLAKEILKEKEAYKLAVEERLLPEALYYNQEFLLKALHADSRFLACIPAPFLSENNVPFLLKVMDAITSLKTSSRAKLSSIALRRLYELLPEELQKNQDFAMQFCTRGMQYISLHEELRSNSAFLVKIIEKYEQLPRKTVICQAFCEQSRATCDELLKNPNARGVLLSDRDIIEHLAKNNYSITSLCSAAQSPQQLINQYPGTILLAPQEPMQDKQAVVKAAAFFGKSCEQLYRKLPESLKSDVEVAVAFVAAAKEMWFIDQSIWCNVGFLNAACDLLPDLPALVESIHVLHGTQQEILSLARKYSAKFGEGHLIGTIPKSYMEDPQFVSALFTIFVETKTHIPLSLLEKVPKKTTHIAHDIIENRNVTS